MSIYIHMSMCTVTQKTLLKQEKRKKKNMGAQDSTLRPLQSILVCKNYAFGLYLGISNSVCVQPQPLGICKPQLSANKHCTDSCCTLHISLPISSLFSSWFC